MVGTNGEVVNSQENDVEHLTTPSTHDTLGMGFEPATHQVGGGVPVASEEVPLGHTEAFAPPLPAQHALDPRRRTPSGAWPHAVVSRLPPLETVRTEQLLWYNPLYPSWREGGGRLPLHPPSIPPSFRKEIVYRVCGPALQQLNIW